MQPVDYPLDSLDLHHYAFTPLSPMLLLMDHYGQEIFQDEDSKGPLAS